jgi:hypothetical protein
MGTFLEYVQVQFTHQLGLIPMKHTQGRMTDERLHARGDKTTKPQIEMTRIRFTKTVDTNTDLKVVTTTRRILAAKEAINHLLNALFWV